MIAAALIMVTPTVVAAMSNYVVLYFDLFKALKRPISARLFGANKTWRGLLSLTALGVLGGAFAWLLESQLMSSSHYSAANFYWAGGLQGLAWALGELPNSWLKRRANVPPGEARVPGWKGRMFVLLNQFDSPLACCLVAFLIFEMSVLQLLFVILLGALLHFYVNYALYLMGIRKARPH